MKKQTIATNADNALIQTRTEMTGTVSGLSILSSLPFFLIPAVVMGFTLYAVEPWLINSGIPPYYASAICLYAPLGLLGFMALIFAQRETGKGIAARLRLFRLTRADAVWTIGLTVAMLLPFALVDSAIRPIFARLLWLMPRYIPEAFRVGAVDWTASTGYPVQGNWPLAITAVIAFVLNIGGEELWWRGYVFPRQEAGMGKKSWLAHGLLWALFHAPKYWAIPALIPGTLAAAFVAYKRKSTTCVLVAHAVANGIGLVSLLVMIIPK